MKKNLFDICINLGICHYAFDKSLDIYIELAQIKRKPCYEKFGIGVYTFKISILRFEVQ